MSSNRPAPPRNFILECWEMDPDLAEETWRTWSTTIHEPNALKIRDRLLSRGHRARVRNSATGEISGEKEADTMCPHCQDTHDEPFDGGCLL